MKRPLSDQVLVVAGASSGIGRAVARAVGALGHAVAEIEAAGGSGLAVAGEATSQDDAESLCARAVERFGRIDTFVATVMVTV